ncbi:MAG: hypothetical protein ABIG39_01335 [Candidatus Micrarchaeota archaeon]
MATRGISFSKAEVELVIEGMSQVTGKGTWKPSAEEKKTCVKVLKKFQSYLAYMEKVGFW